MRIVITVPDCAPVRSLSTQHVKDGVAWFLMTLFGISEQGIEVEVER
jgi:hypothetical protein